MLRHTRHTNNISIYPYQNLLTISNRLCVPNKVEVDLHLITLLKPTAMMAKKRFAARVSRNDKLNSNSLNTLLLT